MPRIHQKAAEYRQNDFLAAIRKGQAKADIMKITDLSQAADIPYSTMYKRLQTPDKLTAEEIRKLLTAIYISPIELLKFFGYSAKDIKNAIAADSQAVGKEEKT